jgi:hypothetical protein
MAGNKNDRKKLRENAQNGDPYSGVARVSDLHFADKPYRQFPERIHVTFCRSLITCANNSKKPTRL